MSFLSYSFNDRFDTSWHTVTFGSDSRCRNIHLWHITRNVRGFEIVIPPSEEEQPKFSRLCKFEAVWEWQSFDKENAPTNYGPAFRGEARVTEKLCERMKKMQGEEEKWSVVQKQFNYHIGQFQQMIQAAKSNAECIIICRDMLNPDKNFAHHDPIFSQLGQAGKIAFDTYLSAVRSELNYRERVKLEEHSQPRQAPDRLPFLQNWQRSREELQTEVNRLQGHGILVYEDHKGKLRWVWSSTIQDLGLYLLHLSGLKWLSSTRLYARTSEDLLFEERKSGKRKLANYASKKIKGARDNANRGWNQKSGKRAYREKAKGTEVMEKLLRELSKEKRL